MSKGRIESWLFLIVVLFLGFITPPTGTLEEIIRKFETYQKTKPREKIYLHLDKPIYAAGEDVWFSVYLVDASNHQPGPPSKVVYAELYRSDGKLIQQRILYTPYGSSNGDFHLADTLGSGTYLIRAYTEYMKNVGEEFFFNKEVTVLSRSKGEKNHTSTAPDILFFPEGGNLLAGVENRVAFKAFDSYGKAMDAEGEVIDKAGNTITTFRSDYQGMGIIKIKPGPGEIYKVRIKGVEKMFVLPDVEKEGYTIRMLETNPYIKIIISYNSPSSAPSNVYLLTQSRGMIRYTLSAKMKQTLVCNIPKNQLPTGISQITLFDSVGSPQCERLVFVNHQDYLKLSVTSNKTEYAPKEKVTLNLQVMQDRAAVQGQFSLSVYDESKIPNPEKYPSSITNNLLLTSDLQGRVVEPGYYLKDTLPSTKFHVDLLMMTQGWRRFVWKSILDLNPAQLAYPYQEGINLSGQAFKPKSDKPIKNIVVKVADMSGDNRKSRTDESGNFYYAGLVFYDSTQLILSAETEKGAPVDFSVKIKPAIEPPRLNHFFSPFAELPAASFLDQTEEILRNKMVTSESIMMKEVVIKADAVPLDKRTKLYNSPDVSIGQKDLKNANNLAQALQGTIAGLTMGESGARIRGSRGFGYGSPESNDPLYLLNGIQIDKSVINNIPIQDVETVDVLKNPENTSLYGSRGANGVIAIYTKPGNLSPTVPIGAQKVKYSGLYRAREFYSPKYAHAEEEKQSPDIRNTLYWNPSMRTDLFGKTSVTFFTSESASSYRIVVEGIGWDGMPGTGTGHFEVH